MSHIADIPPTRIWMNTGLHLERQVPGSWIQGTAHGVVSVPGQVLQFSVLLDNGAQIGRVPIHWLHTKEYALSNSPWEAQYWNCLSRDIAVHEYSFLSGLEVSLKLRGGAIKKGRYLFTVEFQGGSADEAGVLGNKPAHIIRTEGGGIYAYPNNRIAWNEPATVAKPFSWDAPPQYKLIEKTYSCENFIWADNETAEKPEDYFY
jgi:hypothetical protein